MIWRIEIILLDVNGGTQNIDTELSYASNFSFLLNGPTVDISEHSESY